MSEEELLTELRSGAINFDDRAMELINSYTQEKCREAGAEALATLFSEYGTITNPNYTYMINDRDLKRRIAQLNKSKGE